MKTYILAKYVIYIKFNLLFHFRSNKNNNKEKEKDNISAPN